MTSSFTRQPARKVFVLVALVASAAGAVVGTWFRPAAITHAAPASAVPAAPSASEAPLPAASAASSAEPAPNTDVTPVTPAGLPGAGDLSRLRARSLTLPVSGAGAAQLTDTYTQARAAGAPHEALDIMAPRGKPVLAVEDGRVAELFLSKPGGITLYQFDPGGEFAYYHAHLDRYADGLVEGGCVRKGEVSAFARSTGNASPEAPHLHFAIFKLGPEKQWWHGTPLNPFLVWRDSKP
ncbi:M23 family metallopeptidase [Polaromonas sp.]|uniref:M23 family metallopeptidase n=1 Tax=Polaromonas sp. TaxID=1869339 RepID=UPI00356B57D4